MLMLDFCHHGVPKHECGICRKELKATPSINFFEQPKNWELEQIPIRANFDINAKIRETIKPPKFTNRDNGIVEDLRNDQKKTTEVEKRSIITKDIIKSPDLIDIKTKFLKKEE